MDRIVSIYSDSNDGREPAHIQVRTPEGERKSWLQPHVAWARNRGVRVIDLGTIERLVFRTEKFWKERLSCEYHNSTAGWPPTAASPVAGRSRNRPVRHPDGRAP